MAVKRNQRLTAIDEFPDCNTPDMHIQRRVIHLQAVGAMVSLLEPLMIIMMGGAVGFIVISLFLPLIELLNKIGSTAG